MCKAVRRFPVLVIAIALGAVSPAWAVPQCVPLAKLKMQFDKETRFTKLTPGQTNFARGGYIATPPVNGKPPAGDTAMLATHDGERGGVILWMRGSLVCEPTPIPQAFLDAMKGVKTGPLDTDGDEI